MPAPGEHKTVQARIKKHRRSHNLVIDERTKRVAQRVSEFPKRKRRALPEDNVILPAPRAWPTNSNRDRSLLLIDTTRRRRSSRCSRVKVSVPSPSINPAM